MTEQPLLYRSGVGMMIINRQDRVFIGQRLDSSLEAWQMPQGGIDPGEDAWTAALREMREETGIAPELVQQIGETPNWITYDLPPEWQGRLWGGRYKGQRQKWYALRFLGDDRDVNIATEEPEFRAWKWTEMATLPDLIIPFKRQIYTDLVRLFRPLISG